MHRLEHIDAIGDLIALRWKDGTEHFIPMERLRAWSPSAENTGERDLLGNQIGGTDQKEFPGVVVKGWRIVGGYALQFDFSDGHSTGIFSWEYLYALGERVK
jgi:DUF971 family protein